MTTLGVRPQGPKNKPPGANGPEKGLPTPRPTTETPQNRIKSSKPVRFAAAC